MIKKYILKITVIREGNASLTFDTGEYDKTQSSGVCDD